jgi:hypothetical protein
VRSASVGSTARPTTGQPDSRPITAAGPPHPPTVNEVGRADEGNERGVRHADADNAFDAELRASRRTLGVRPATSGESARRRGRTCWSCGSENQVKGSRESAGLSGKTGGVRRGTAGATHNLIVQDGRRPLVVQRRGGVDLDSLADGKGQRRAKRLADASFARAERVRTSYVQSCRRSVGTRHRTRRRSG